MSMTGRPLLERGEELRRIEGCLAAARAGAGSVLMIEGPAGIGKTALLDSARTAARAAGMTVTFARGAELEHEFAYGAVGELLEPPLAAAGEQARGALLAGAAGLAAPLLAPAAGSRSVPGPPLADPSFAVLHGLYWLCANLAARGPLLVAVDDAHWADVASLRFLAYLARRLDELAVALVLAARPDDAGGPGELATELQRNPAATVVPGNDRIYGRSGKDRLTGGAGSDWIAGSTGGDRITGGGGTDVLDGGKDNDTILARDGRRDRIVCGTGKKDRVLADGVDNVAADCESVARR